MHKQNDNEDRSVVTGEQMSMATALQQPFQHFSLETSSQKPIDLSCHEMDTGIDCGTSADQENVDEDMNATQGNGNTCCLRPKLILYPIMFVM